MHKSRRVVAHLLRIFIQVDAEFTPGAALRFFIISLDQAAVIEIDRSQGGVDQFRSEQVALVQSLRDCFSAALTGGVWAFGSSS
jgi:hypothetical protein